MSDGKEQERKRRYKYKLSKSLGGGKQRRPMEGGGKVFWYLSGSRKSHRCHEQK